MPAYTPVESAMVPAAGYGTRLRPLTEVIAKEMLPVGRRPVLEHVVSELKTAGVRRVLFIVSPHKEMIQRYFGDGSRFGVECEYVVQQQMRGLGDAILHGEAWAGRAPFVVAFGDTIIQPAEQPPLSRLAAAHESTGSAATVLAQRIPRERTGKYGIVDPASAEPGSDPFRVRDIVEKPAPDDAPSTLAVAARWVLTSAVFPYLRNALPGPDGEVNLTNPVREMLREGAPAWAVPLREGESREDIGGWETYFVAAVKAAVGDPDVGPRVRQALGLPGQPA